MKFKNSTVLLHVSFTVAILALLSIFGYAGVSFNALIESNQRVSNTMLVQDRLDKTLGLLIDAETSQRGYIITGDQAFLEPFTDALDPQTGIRARLAELRELTNDDPNQQERLDRLEELIEAKLQFMQENIDLYDTAGFEAAQASVAGGQGREQMEAIRALIQEIQGDESARLRSRSDAASASLRTVQLIAGVGVPLALAMLMVIFSLLAGQMRERRRTQESLQKLIAELDQRVTERTAALAESERNYRDLADNALIGIYRSTFKGELLYVNDTLVRMMGFDTPDSMIQSGAVARWRDPSSRQAFIEQLQRAGIVENFENVVLKANGEPMPILISARILGGQLTGTVLDITERKRMEEALRKSEQTFSVIFNKAPFAAALATLSGGAYVEVNEEFERVFGFGREEIVGKTSLELGMYPDEEARAKSAAKFREQGFLHNLEARLRTRTGVMRDVLINTELVEIVGEKYILTTANDITERKQAEDALRQSEEQYRSLFEDSPIALWVEDFSEVKRRLDKLKKTGIKDIPAHLREHPDFVGECARQVRVLDVNSAAMKMYHARQKSELLGSLPDALRAFSLEQFEGELIQIANGWLNFGGEEIDHTLTGENIYVNARWSVAPGYEDSLAKVLVSTIDITERKRAEEDRLAREVAERASEAKSEFLSRMSHELRTPMNSILGFAQLLKMDELTPDQMGSLDQILKSGRHLLDLINEVLDIARIESGRVHLSPEPVHVAEALAQAVDLINPLADERGIRIEVRVPSSRDVFVTADRQRLRQVLLNLLSNAVKYNRENGEILVTASLLVDGFLHLAVRDTGEGIAPDKIDRLFIAFDRLGIESNIEGTGLGLALSKGLVEAMGGRIGAKSVVGEGSTFWFDLKLTTQQKEEVVMAEVDDYLKDAAGPKKGLVLYVEDNLSNVQLIEKILARLPGVELITAMQGRLAMDLARQHKPALILLDLHLPDVHGEEVLKWLHAEPETRDIPIVVMSADATPHQIERALAAGARAYLTKPINVKEFLKMIGDMLGRS